MTLGRIKFWIVDIQKHLDSLSLESINGLVPEILRKQGKGWGSTTTDEEVSALISLIEAVVGKVFAAFGVVLVFVGPVEHDLFA